MIGSPLIHNGELCLALRVKDLFDMKAFEVIATEDTLSLSNSSLNQCIKIPNTTENRQILAQNKTIELYCQIEWINNNLYYLNKYGNFAPMAPKENVLSVLISVDCFQIALKNQASLTFVENTPENTENLKKWLGQEVDEFSKDGGEAL